MSKEYEALYKCLENIALELANDMMDCEEGSYKELEGLAYKIINELYEVIMISKGVRE
jgi:hypothetical protein